MEIVPVLDLMNSMAVSGKSGKRETYSPLHSVYSSSPNPVEIANGLKLANAKEMYIADLNLIEKDGNHNVNDVRMVNTILPVMLDAGVNNFESFKFFLEFAFKIIVATETLESLEELEKIFETFPKERIVISVDIKDNELYSKNLNLSLDEFKKELKKLDPNEIILLDISSVGTESGFNQKLLNNFAYFKDKLILGGGITKEEIEELSDFGIKKVLVGSALHNGELKI